MNMKNQRSYEKKKNVMKKRGPGPRGEKGPIGCTGNDGIREENEDILGLLVHL
jgi:hypothetical protein